MRFCCVHFCHLKFRPANCIFRHAGIVKWYNIISVRDNNYSRPIILFINKIILNKIFLLCVCIKYILNIY